MIPKVLAITLSGPVEILGRWIGVPITLGLSGSDDGTDLTYSSGCLTQSDAKYYEWYEGGVCGEIIGGDCLNFNFEIPDKAAARTYEYKSCSVGAVIHCTGGGDDGTQPWVEVTFRNYTGTLCLDSDPGLIHIDGRLRGAPYYLGCLFPCDCGLSPVGVTPAIYAYEKFVSFRLESGSVCSPVNISGATLDGATLDGDGATDAGCGAVAVTGVLTE